MSTRVPLWTPGFVEALRLAKKPLIIYFLFTALGFAALFITSVWFEGGKEVLSWAVGTLAGILGVLAGQVVALVRVRVLPIVLVGGTVATIGGLLLASLLGSTLGPVLLLSFVFFCFAFPCGMLSLQHNSEILACFFPSIGWVGSAIWIINESHKVTDWEKDRVSVWMPVPLALLGLYLIFMLLFLASKQTMRTELWQALSGAAERRVSKRAATLSMLPRRNLLPLLFVTLLVFGFTAILAPYMWRTGKGKDRSGEGTEHPSEGEGKEGEGKGPPMDMNGVERIVRQMVAGAKSAAETLWPLLVLLILLMIFYRPLKRWLVLTHLRSPIFPAPPSERIENLWEYVRIAAGDRGTVLTASDSVEDFMRRLPTGMTMTPALAEAADIYARTRYGFVLRPGDAQAMRVPATRAAMELRVGMDGWETVKSWWRELR